VPSIWALGVNQPVRIQQYLSEHILNLAVARVRQEHKGWPLPLSYTSTLVSLKLEFDSSAMSDLAAKLKSIEQALDEVKTLLEFHVGASSCRQKGKTQRGERKWALTLRDLIFRCSTVIQDIREQFQRDSSFHSSYKGIEGPNAQPAAKEAQPHADAYGGGSCDVTNAESVNYGDNGWTTNGSMDCDQIYPRYPAPRNPLEFRAADELQCEQEDPRAFPNLPQSRGRQSSPNTITMQADSIDKNPCISKEQTTKPTKVRGLRAGTDSGVRSTVVSLKGTTISSSKRKSTADHSQLDDSLLHKEKKRINGQQRPSPWGLQETITEMGQIEKTSRIPQFPPFQRGVTPQLLKLVVAISSRAAFAQFHGLVSSARDRNVCVTRANVDGNLCSPLVQHVQGIAASERMSLLEKFMVRIHQVMLAKDLESVNDDRLKTDPLVIKRVLKETGWTRSLQ
jgi:hypothetical protein